MICILFCKEKSISQVCKVSKRKDCNDIIYSKHKLLNDKLCKLNSINMDKYDMLCNICKGMISILGSRHSYNICRLDKVKCGNIKCSKYKHIRDSRMTFDFLFNFILFFWYLYIAVINLIRNKLIILFNFINFKLYHIKKFLY